MKRKSKTIIISFSLFLIISLFNGCNSTEKKRDYSKIKVLISNSKFDEALNELNMFDDTSYMLPKFIGICYFMNKDYTTSLFHLREAFLKNNKDYEILLYSGQCKENLNLIDEAIIDYNKILHNDSNNSFAQWRIGKYYLTIDSISKSLFHLRKALNSDSLNYNLWNDYGLSLIEDNDSKAGIKAYSKAISINPIDEGLFFNRGIAYFHSGNINLAIEDFNIAIKKKRDPKFLLNRGICYFYLNNLEDACADWHEAKSSGLLQADGYIKQYCIKEKTTKRTI